MAISTGVPNYHPSASGASQSAVPETFLDPERQGLQNVFLPGDMNGSGMAGIDRAMDRLDLRKAPTFIRQPWLISTVSWCRGFQSGERKIATDLY